MVTQDGNDQVRIFPVVENRHANHILHTTIAPAPNLSAELQTQIDQLATTIAKALNLRGVLGIELFETAEASWSTNWPRGRTTLVITASKPATFRSLTRIS